MSYQFSVQDRIPQEIRRVVSEQIVFAIDCLQGMEDRHEGIHEARKSLKKIRAVLRLTQSALPPEDFRYANQTARDLGRKLSAIRDASALIEALDQLQLLHPDWMEADTQQEIRQLLEIRRDQLFHQSIETEQLDKAVITELEVFAQVVADWKPTQRSFQGAFQPGLETIYTKGIAAFHLAMEQPNAHHFHEWRKRVKDLWYHVLLLEASWPAVLIPFGDSLHLLSDVLGDEHDLNVFHEQLSSGEITLKTAQTTQRLLSLFEQQVEVLRIAARELGQKMYADNPATFGKQFLSSWREKRRELLPATRS